MTEETLHHEFKKGDIIFNEGDSSDFIYHIQQGHLEIYTHNNDKRVILGNIKPGEFVGELGVLQNTRRSASAIALQATRVERLNLSDFINRISQDQKKSLKLLHSLSHRTRNVALLIDQTARQIAEHKHKRSLNPLNTVLSFGSRLFALIKLKLHQRALFRYKNLTPVKLDNGIHAIKKGHVLFYEGQESHFACQIINGKFKAIKSLHNSYEDIGTMHTGEHIGELGLIEGSPRSLTVIALTDSKIEVFNENAFLDHVSQNPQVGFTLIKNLSHRAIRLNQHLKDLTEQHADALNPTALKQTKRLLQNIGDVSHLTGQMLEQDLYKLQAALRLEAVAVQDMLEIYYRYINGEATQEQMEQANADFRNFLKTLGLGALIIIPGSFVTIPIIVKMSKSVGIDILPKIRS